MNILSLPDTIQQNLCKMCLALFPEYDSATLTSKNKLVFTLKNSGILFGIFKKRVRFDLPYFLFWEITDQISINRWQSKSLARDVFRPDLLKLNRSGIGISLEDLENWIFYLLTEVGKVEVLDIHSCSEPIKIVKGIPQNLRNKVNKFTKKAIIDPLNRNRAILSKINSYREHIANNIRIGFNPAVWILLFQLARGPLSKTINIASFFDAPAPRIIEGVSKFFIT